MGKLASLLLAKGVTVSGSDLSDNAMVRSLREQGAQIEIGHRPENIKERCQVVYSSAVRENNPEMTAARKHGCHIMKRAQLLADLMKEHFSITVAGAHGKTTTTSMIAHMLIHSGLDPTVALGGVFQQGSYQENLGQSGYFVAELDESDGSFLFFSPKISVITNIDFEHVDYYGDWKHILDAYAQFIRQTAQEGVVVACGDDDRLRCAVEESGRAAVFYGLQDRHDFYARDIRYENGKTCFQCIRGHQDLGRLSLGVCGTHNVLNALSCMIVGLRLGLPFSAVKEALSSYQGVRRRLEAKGSWGDIRLFDDYGHHPTEIRATLAAVREMRPDRVVVVFQPHRYTRTKFLWNEFLGAFGDADELLVTDIYPAGEDAMEGVDAGRLCAEISRHSGKSVVFAAKEDLTRRALEMIRPGDVVVTLGAGDITRVSDDIARLLEERFAVRHG